jgi:hypothetical protein
MKSNVEKSFDFAADLSKQLITLASGIIAITVTFSKDIFTNAPPDAKNWLVASWIVFFISILGGIWSLMALTGTLDPIGKEARISIQGANCRIPALFQIVLFLVAFALTIIYAIKAL